MRRTRAAAGVLIFVMVMGLAVGVHAQEYSGAYYVGDSNGNGLIEPGDIAKVQQQFATGAADYSAVKPPYYDVAELNGNGNIDPPDISILQFWFVGNFATGAVGKPGWLAPVGLTSLSLQHGESVVVCADLSDLAGVGDPNTTERAGWGVNFIVDPAGACNTALIYGRNPWPTVDDEYGYYSTAFEYTDRLAANGGHGRACVRVLPPLTGCDSLDIIVKAYVPDDQEALCNGLPGPCFGSVGRFPTRLDAVADFNLNVLCACPYLAVTPDPADLNDGHTVRLTATHSIFGDVTNDPLTDWSVFSGPCSVSNTAPDKGLVSVPEGCATDACEIDAVYDVYLYGTAAVNVIDDEAGTWDALRAPVCSPGNDIVNVAASCTPPQRYSTADNCDRGLASCAWSCTGDCGELCMPTASGTYNGCCTDGAHTSCGSNAVTNNEQVPVVVDVTPDSPGTMFEGQTLDFACMASYADACTEDCTLGAVWMDINATPPPCGDLDGGGNPQYRYTAANGLCTEEIRATWRGVSDSELVTVGGCCTGPPEILTVFPLEGQPNIPARNWSNAHIDQVLTAVMQAPGGGVGNATSITATCTGPSTVNFTCNLSGYPTDLDVPCTPTSAFLGSSTYSCTVIATNVMGSDTVTANLYTGPASAPVDGGHAGGYVGGNNWDSTTSTCNSGPVTICAANQQTNAAILEKVYVQIQQAGEPVVERFTSAATGCVSVTLPCKPIDELHLGFKCGQASCPKLEDGATYSQYKYNLSRNYAYTTVNDIDAADIVTRMSLMDDAVFGRWKQRIQGTIGENYFTAYIAPRPGTPTSRVRARYLFNAPVKLRAALVLTTLSGLKEASDTLDLLLLTPEYETSITICAIPRDNVDIPLAVSLPPNVILPELVRSNWTGGCVAWTTNPGRYTWEYWARNPGQYRNVWSVGAYINASQINIDGGLDPFSFPIYACGLGTYGITTDSDLATDPVRDLGTNVGFRYDLREKWDATPLGYDPDAGLDRKVLFSVRGKALPIDPGRQGAALRPISVYRVPNYSDSEVTPDATWDDRFYRRNVGIISGADFGSAAGLGITGLSLRPNIDDYEFTTFKVGYIQSIGSNTGNRDIRYWAATTGDTDNVSIQQAGIASTWTDPAGTNIDFSPIDTDGPTNYAGISVLMRPLAQDGRSTDPDFALEYQGTEFRVAGFNPGTIVGVWHIGPLEDSGNEAIPVNDFLNLSQAQAPGPDEYVYPGPQWANTIRGSRPINRNGELWRYLTAGVGDGIPTSGGRYYFQFSRPTFQYATTRAVHLWAMDLAEPGYLMANDGVSSRAAQPKYSLRSRIYDDDGYATGVNEFNDSDARFQSWGVAAGDTLWVNSRRNVCFNDRSLITAVVSQTRVLVSPNWGAAGNCTITGDISIRYRIWRANKKGECRIDEGYGGGPPGYSCRSNTFWYAQGPADSNPVRVYAPNITPGPATFAGATGYVPSFFDGVTQNDILHWTYSFLVFNTGSSAVGGLGGPFNFNTWETRQDERTFQHGSFDRAVVIRQ